MNIFKVLSIPLLAFISLSCAAAKTEVSEKSPEDKIIVGYVTSWSNVTPDPAHFDVLNYAFGHVNETFDGINIDNIERFRQMARLKETNPDLKVVLSVGGWGSGRFSEMAASDSLRNAFANNCRRIIDLYNIDGIDIDWEYPTIGWADISSSPDDTKNFTLLMSDIREAISEDKILTLASSATAKYVDFKEVVPLVDYVNLMTYDMSDGRAHHAPLFSSSISSEMTADQSVRLHLEAGIPTEKIVLGIPFYGRGVRNGETFYCDFKNIKPGDGEHEEWDPLSQSPFIADSDGNFILGFDNPESIRIKCDYILENNLKGAMFWDYNGDDDRNSLSNAIIDVLRKR